MGGLGPGIGGLELLVIALVALLVVGPKDLPLMLRKLGKLMGKARAMANEFRSSFDEMARQSELDELRKEVEALRTGQGVHRLGPDADAAFREIRDDLNRDLKPAPTPAPALSSPEGWSEVDQMTAPPPAETPTPAPADAPVTKAPRRKAAAATKSVATDAEPVKAAPAKRKPAAKPRARKTAS